MKDLLLPKTKFGKWSVWFCLTFLISLAAFFVAREIIRPKEFLKFFENFWLTIPLLLCAASGALSLIFGLVSIFRSKERAVLVFISSLIGLFVTLWVSILCVG